MTTETCSQMSVSELTNAVQSTLLKLRYSSATLCIYDCIWRDLNDYCSRNGIASFDEDVGNHFAIDCYDYRIGDPCKKEDDFRKKTVGRAMQHLLDFQSYGVVFQISGRDRYQWHPQFKEAFNRYLAEMMHRGYEKSTLQTIKSCISGFQDFSLQNGIKDLSELTKNNIEAFLLTFSKYARSTIPSRLNYLRTMLQFFYDSGVTTENLALVCPRVMYGNFANSIPSFFTSDEVTRILSSIDRESPVGKRDYALILLVARTGLRSVDAIRLKFTDIDWHKKQLYIVQSKTKETVVLPLLEDVGWAIIDYLQNGRPQTPCEFIFVKHSPENGYYGEFVTNPYSMLQKYLSRAQISSEFERKHGLHALRHSLANELLTKETPLPIISGILGHKNTQTTGVYLKIDIGNLKKCALEVSYEE